MPSMVCQGTATWAHGGLAGARHGSDATWPGRQLPRPHRPSTAATHRLEAIRAIQASTKGAGEVRQASLEKENE